MSERVFAQSMQCVVARVAGSRVRLPVDASASTRHAMCPTKTCGLLLIFSSARADCQFWMICSRRRRSGGHGEQQAAAVSSDPPFGKQAGRHE